MRKIAKIPYLFGQRASIISFPPKIHNKLKLNKRSSSKNHLRKKSNSTKDEKINL